VTAITIAILVVVLSGFFHRAVRQVFAELFVPARDRLAAARENWFRHATAADQRRRHYMEQLEFAGSNWKASYLAGAALFTAAFPVEVSIEWLVVALTLAPLLGIELPRLAKRLDPAVAMQASVILPVILGLWVLYELLGERGHLIPVRRLRPWQRRITILSAALVVMLSLAVAFVLAVYRSAALADDGTGIGVGTVVGALPAADEVVRLDQPPEAPVPPEVQGAQPASAWENRARTFTMPALAISLLLSAELAWKFGPALLLELAPAGVLAGVATFCRLLGLACGFFAFVIIWLAGALLAVIMLVQRVGIAATRPVVTAFRSLHRWASSAEAAATAPPAPQSMPESLAARSQRLAAACAIVLSSWSLDLEVPQEPIGEATTLDPPSRSNEPAPGPPAAQEAAGATPDPGPAGPAPHPQTFQFEIEPAGATRPSRGWNPFEGDEPPTIGGPE